MSSGTSSTVLGTQVSAPAEATNPPLESLPSVLDVPANHEPIDLDNDRLQDSIQRVLQAATAVHQRPTWSLYQGLNKTDQRITGTEENRDPGAYVQELRQDIQNAHQQSPEGVVVQGRVSKSGAWTNLAGSPRAGSPDLHPRFRRPTASNPRRNSGGSRPNPAQLNSRPHHCPTRQNRAPLCMHCNMPTDQRVHG